MLHSNMAETKADSKSMDAAYAASDPAVVDSKPLPIIKQTNYETIPPSEKELECAICTDTCVDPVKTICGHLYCKSCLSPDNGIKTCPSCRTPLDYDKVRDLDPVQDRPICNMISRAVVKCKHCKKDVIRGLKGELFEKHWLHECPIQCPHKCTFKDRTAYANSTGGVAAESALFRADLQSHETVCPLLEIPCSGKEFGCSTVLPRNEMHEHEECCIRAKLAPIMSQMQAKIVEQECKLIAQARIAKLQEIKLEKLLKCHRTLPKVLFCHNVGDVGGNIAFATGDVGGEWTPFPECKAVINENLGVDQIQCMLIMTGHKIMSLARSQYLSGAARFRLKFTDGVGRDVQYLPHTDGMSCYIQKEDLSNQFVLQGVMNITWVTYPLTIQLEVLPIGPFRYGWDTGHISLDIS
jgi:hypothetical protein